MHATFEFNTSGIQCAQLDIPQNGDVEVINAVSGTQLNARAHYSCSHRYTLVGQSIRVCGLNKTWSDSAPQCSKCCQTSSELNINCLPSLVSDCPPLPMISNGEVMVPQRGTPIHTVVEYSCHTGSQLIGNKTLTCLENSQWSNTPPVCTGNEFTRGLNSPSTLLKVDRDKTGQNSTCS